MFVDLGLQVNTVVLNLQTIQNVNSFHLPYLGDFKANNSCLVITEPCSPFFTHSYPVTAFINVITFFFSKKVLQIKYFFPIYIVKIHYAMICGSASRIFYVCKKKEYCIFDFHFV